MKQEIPFIIHSFVYSAIYFYSLALSYMQNPTLPMSYIPHTSKFDYYFHLACITKVSTEHFLTYYGYVTLQLLIQLLFYYNTHQNALQYFCNMSHIKEKQRQCYYRSWQSHCCFIYRII